MHTYRERIEAGLNADIFCDDKILVPAVAREKERFLEAAAAAPALLEACKKALIHLEYCESNHGDKMDKDIVAGNIIVVEAAIAAAEGEL